MKTLRKIAFLIEEFALQTPAQQLVDRFLIGYPRDGEFHRLEGCRVSVALAGDNAELDRRVKDYGLVRETEAANSVAGADAVIVVPRGSGAVPNEALNQTALEKTAAECSCFMHGALAASLAGAQRLAELAKARKIQLLAGTPLPVTWRLPDVDLETGTAVREALIVVQGPAPTAEWHGLEGLWPVIERRQGGETGVRGARLLKGPEVWKAGESGRWSWPLLAAALSRSDTPQGNAVKDGRTEDLVGLGLVPKLAREPRGWLIEHSDGLRSTVLVLDGVIADYNFAVQKRDGAIVSAQIYRPPAPSDHQYSRLAEVLEECFRSAKSPWPLGRNILTSGLLEAFRKGAEMSDGVVATPDLGRLAYSAITR